MERRTWTRILYPRNSCLLVGKPDIAATFHVYAQVFFSRIANGFPVLEFLDHRWTRFKGGRAARGPMLGFRDGIHVKFSANHN
ncbi:hypothetical protein SADUNF_Sadunf04G0146200 [Salix dunnii]|uniref:Uncharacterized protein n=1 Tax=Salix dunnii TaxID=1413687 RepID=A0A835KG71_9ROSI|nr:hypothetical protein SADUNF_Sadunf04G0146200 [Salix dunnii]